MISFVTPYLSGTWWLEAHMASIRKFHPEDEIIICAPDGSVKKLVEKYNGRYFDNNTDYWQAVEFLFQTASHDTILISDCDTVLFRNVNYLAKKLKNFDIVGIEERIRHITKARWARWAPGYMDLTFFMFSRKNAKIKDKAWPDFPWYGLDDPNNQNQERHYKFCKVMPKHYYLRPYGTEKYGLGNLIRDGEKNIIWHQWFGSWEKRPKFISDRDREENPYKNIDQLKAAEQRFMKDYPNPDFSNVKPLF